MKAAETRDTLGLALPGIPLGLVDLAVILSQVRPASHPGRVEDGTRVHVHYGAFGPRTDEAKTEALRAAELELPLDRYTGRVSRVWKSKDGSLCIRLYVELERKQKYRTLNVTKGSVFKFVVLGD